MTQMKRHLPGAQLFFNQLKGVVQSCPACRIELFYPVPSSAIQPGVGCNIVVLKLCCIEAVNELVLHTVGCVGAQAQCNEGKAHKSHISCLSSSQF